MKELPKEKLIIYGVSVLLVIALVPILTRLPRTRGKNPIFHGVFGIGAAFALSLLPHSIQDEVFSPGGVVVLGTVLPVYQSVVAVCTPGESDDAVWLAYWVVAGSLSYATEFIDEIKHIFPEGGEHWYEFEFLITLWMLLPLTDGASLVYDYVVEPYLAPTAQKVKAQAEGYLALLMTLVNSSYIWFVWYVFLRFTEEQRRFLVVAVGTVYPVAASVVALTTISSKEKANQGQPSPASSAGFDDGTSYWLTYWSTFSLLFLAMDYLENFVGHIPGFYSACLVATVYLFLPLFQGADVIFRNILVPMSGQRQALLLHDAYLVQQQLIQSGASPSVLEQAARMFQEGRKMD